MADITAPTYGDTDERLKPVKEGNDNLLKKALGGMNLGGFDPDAYGKLIQQKSEAAGEVAKAEQEQKRIAAQGEYEARKAYGDTVRKQYEAAKPTLMAPPPKFNVTKDTEQGLTGLAALMTIGGMIIGSKGAMSGVNAMNAMTGVLKGYQEGNQQRIDFETKKYEQSIKDWERTLEQTKSSLEQYQKLAAVDLSTATAKAAADAAAKGQTVIAAKIKQEGISQTIAMVDKLIQQTSSSKTQWATINGQTGLYSPAEIRSAQESGLAVSQAQKGQAGRSALARQFDDQVTISVNEAAAQIKNMTNLPFATSGLYGGQNPEGFFKAPLGSLVNALTPGSVQQYNNNVQGLGYELAKMLGGGRAVPVSTQKAFADRFQIRMGDAPFTVLEKLANMRQSFEKGIEVKIASADTPPEMKEIYARALKDIQSSIPFTVSDVLEAQQKAALSKGKKLETFGDYMQKKMGGRQIAEEPKTETRSSSVVETENRKKARDALSKGAPRDAVIKMLEDAGEDTSGL